MRADAPGRHQGRVLTGIALIVAAAVIFPATDAIAKHLASRYHPLQILWARYLVQLAMMLPLLTRRSLGSLLRSRRPALQIGRSLTLVLGTLAFVGALRFIPLVDAIAILFSNALIMVALSAPLLGERIDGRRWAAVIAGFAGTLIIMRPGLGFVHWAASLALIAALCNALFQIASRALATSDPAETSLVYVALVGVLAMGPFMPFVWAPMTAEAWLWSAGSAAFAVSGQYLLVKAFNHAPVSVLAPFNYMEILSATALGYFWFGELPDGWTVLGLVVVIGSGLYVVTREGGRKQAAALPTSSADR
ncbi:MAG: DMT family transporter [Alphaproteobacteria bacterium]